jgi:sensor histidine kinase YesM
MLRYTLRPNHAHETTLREELDVLARYLDIMRVRFADQLTIECDTPAELDDVLVPSFVLQPIVENALEHGIARLEEPGRVSVSAASVNESVVLTVTDNGPGSERDVEQSATRGIGIANTRVRLEQLYGAQQSLDVRFARGGGTQVVVRLPLRRASATIASHV